MTENRRVFLNVVATYGRSLYGLALGLLCGRWTLMALGTVDYGLNGLVGGLTAFIAFFNGVLAGANARFYAVSIGQAKVAADKASALEESRRWFNTALTVHTAVPLVLIAIGYPVGVYAVEHWLTIPADRVAACVWVFRFVCVSCFVGMVGVPFSAMYGAKQYIAELTIYSFATSTLNAAVLYYMVSHPQAWLVPYAGWTCLASVVPQLIICVRAACVFPECRIVPAYLFDRARLRHLGVYSGWQTFGCICGILRTNGLAIVVNKFFGAAMNAAQAIGNQVQAQCSQLSGAMQTAFVPVITQAFGEGDYRKMNVFVTRTCKFNVFLSLIFMIPLAIELPEVMTLWLVHPPAFAVGLCYCAMILHLISSSTVGHMVAVNATGKIAAYHVVLCAVNVMLLPCCILVGCLTRNVYAMMAVAIVFEAMNSAGRIYFARRHAQSSAREWLRFVGAPSVLLTALCALVGVVPRLLLPASFGRIVLTTAVCEIVLLPLLWTLILNADERRFVKEKVADKILRKLKT